MVRVVEATELTWWKRCAVCRGAWVARRCDNTNTQRTEELQELQYHIMAMGVTPLYMPTDATLTRGWRSTYTLLNLLGSGTHGEVWEAKSRTGSIVAIKFIKKGDSYLAVHNEVTAMYIFEEGGGVVPCIDYFDDLHEFQYVIVMPRAKESLFDHAQTCLPLNQRSALSIVQQVRRTLCKFHLAGWTHGDVKLENILLYETAPDHLEALLGDTGKAYHCGSEPVESYDEYGTLMYDSPHMKGQRAYPINADYYALSLVLLTLIFAKYPAEVPGYSSGMTLDELLRGLCATSSYNIQLDGDVRATVEALYNAGYNRFLISDPAVGDPELSFMEQAGDIDGEDLDALPDADAEILDLLPKQMLYNK